MAVRKPGEPDQATRMSGAGNIFCLNGTNRHGIPDWCLLSVLDG